MVNGEVADEPDLALRLVEGLRERPEAAITANTGDNIYASAQTFEELPLSADLLKGLYIEMKFERPSLIQAKTLPMILNPPFKDLIAQAHNGSGKTTCFVLAMLSRQVSAGACNMHASSMNAWMHSRLVTILF